MKAFLLCTLLLQSRIFLSAQSYVTELMAGNRYMFYQHVLNQQFKENGNAGFVHIVNMSYWYESNPEKGGMSHEIMNQAYISLKPVRKFTVMGGVFYTNVNSIRPAIAIQFAHTFKNGVLVLVPRADIKKNGSVELMALLEYNPQITKKVKLYSRLQVMSNRGPFHHNRSYQRVRLAVDVKKFQLGLGLNMNEYGYPAKMKTNTGLFLRKVF